MEHLIEGLLRDFELGKMTRRQLVRSLAVAAAVPSSMVYAMAPPAETLAPTGVNHISYGVADYAKTRDFYVNLLGVQVRGDNGSQCQLVLGDSFILARKSQQPDNKPYVDHFAITIADWNTALVEEQLKRRGLDPKPDGASSFLVKDPDGFELQLSAGRRPRA